MPFFAASLSFAGVTAPFFSCVEPTLSFGNCVAAQAPPASAKNSANVATTFE